MKIIDNTKIEKSETCLKHLKPGDIFKFHSCGADGDFCVIINEGFSAVNLRTFHTFARGSINESVRVLKYEASLVVEKELT